MKQTLHLGADHAGFALKETLKKFLNTHGYAVVDHGAKKLDLDDDYPDYARLVARAVQKQGKQGKGILVCGSAEGICIAANKFHGIRAVPIWTLENAKLSRKHNDANILCLSGWQLANRKAQKLALTWLQTPFSAEKRHLRRLQKIERLT